MRIGIVSRPDDIKSLDYAGDLASFIEERGHEVITEESTASALGVPGGISLDEMEAEIVIVIGGDGTVLRTVRQMTKQLPILGVNRGHVGFLAEIEPEEAKEAFKKIEEGKYTIEKRMRLALKVDGDYVGEALNEAVIVTSRPAKIIELTINIDHIPAERFRADGVLISTPTGSTGYAMSAGGPIVDPWIESFLIVPIAAYYLSSRPHVVSSRRRISVELDSTKPADLVIDGKYITDLYNGNVLSVEMSKEPALFVNVGKNFFAKVDKKLKRL